MSKLKKVLLMCTAYMLVAALAIGGTIAYLQDSDSDVNVMTLGNVSIAQHEYERAVDADGNYTTINVDGTTSYELKEFTQDKPLYPMVGDPNDGYDSTTVRLGQLGHNSRGGMDILPDANVQDKFVVVENNGKTDAYVRTLVAFEAGSVAEEDWYKLVNYTSHFTWKETEDWFVVEIEGNNYYVVEFIYNGYEDIQHPNGVLKPGDYTYNSLAQVYLFSHATNEDCIALDGNNNGQFDILVLSQAVQAAGFANAKTALDTGFGVFNEENAAKWFGGVIVPSVKTVAELREAMANGGEYKLAADITVSSSDLDYAIHGDGSVFIVRTGKTVLDLNGHNITVTTGNRASDVFFATGDAELTVKGNGTVTADCGVFVSHKPTSVINIEGGHYKCTVSNDMLYAMYGKLNVSGGTYETAYWNLINIAGQGNISLVDVSGGSFKNWSPATSPDGNLLADGYKVVSEVVDGVTWYTVVAE